MQWIVQNKSYNNDGLSRLIAALNKKKSKYQLIDVIPFSHELVPEPIVTEACVVMGTNTLVKLAKKYNWSPGAWMNENFRFERWLEYYGENLLNHDATVCRFGDAAFEGTAFVRPCEDLKAFSGMEINGEDFEMWRDLTIEGDSINNTIDSRILSPDLPVLISKIKNIYLECRLFVVDGEIVASSRYKIEGRVISSDYVDQGIIDYAKKMIAIWQPARAFVMDIAQLGNDEYKIVEINCLNGSGFYSANVDNIVDAIEAMQM